MVLPEKNPVGGGGRFAKEANNFFGVQAPSDTPDDLVVFSKKANEITGKPAKLWKYDSFKSSAEDAFKRRPYLRGATDPAEFARRLQVIGKFGIIMDTGKPTPGYQRQMVQTIKSVKNYLDTGH
ncbi:glucosaminidase domain-containing protein [Luteibacter sp. dw_328]|uniref:glucosaminidase domain-containing protein n=1 Tax=Luteibacter sp. dw_328 TaxID=2719796 RepID=UPI001BD269DA|nr:glucosaminidase domain-containing protein [Luteibacter sp. dw_328]